MASEPVYVSLEFTPNPNTLKYAVNREIVKSGSLSFKEDETNDAGAQSILAQKLLQIDGINGVMLGKDFVTITKSDDGDWDLVHKEASQTIQSLLESGQPVVVQADESVEREESGISQKIREVIDREIRTAVAMDGGDITFNRFDNGVVFVELSGSCAGCPSSSATLKMGIENRLRELFPEVREVQPV